MISIETLNPLVALSSNKTLKNPETWKKIQNLINILSGMAPTLMLMFPKYRDFLTPEFLGNLALSIGAVNAYLTTATTTKIGL